MKKILLTVVFFLLSINCKSQGISSELMRIQELPYAQGLSGDSLYWSIVKKGIAVVPALINEISDTTTTGAVVPNFGGYNTIGDIAYRIIKEIIHEIPTRDFITSKEDDIGGYWYYWNFVGASPKNRVLFEEKLRVWFNTNQNDFLWYTDDKEYRVYRTWYANSKKHPAEGYYILNKK